MGERKPIAFTLLFDNTTRLFLTNCFRILLVLQGSQQQQQPNILPYGDSTDRYQAHNTNNKTSQAHTQ